MPTFERGQVVRVPFPFADRRTEQHRPAVVIASGVGLNGILIWVAMITAAENRSWPGDIVVDDIANAGLPIPSVIRPAKVAGLTASRAEPLGRVGAAELTALDVQIASYLDFPSSRGGFHE